MTLRVAASMDHGGVANSTAGPALMWNNIGCSLRQATATELENSVAGPFDGRWHATDKYWYFSSSVSGSRVMFPPTFVNDTFWIGFSYYRVSGGSTAGDMFGIQRGLATWDGTSSFVNTGFDVFRINWVSGNDFQAVDAAGTSIGSTFEITEDQWHWFAAEVDATPTGTLTIKIDGITVVSAASGDFQGTSTVSQELYHLCVDLGKGAAGYDDIIVGDGEGSVNTGIPDDTRIETLVPTGDDSLTGFTSTTWDKVDDFDLSDDDTTHTAASAVSDQYTLTTGTIGTSPSSIIGCQLLTKARSTDGGLATLRPRIDSGGTYYNADDFFLPPIDYLCNSFIWELDPDAGPGAWTESAVNAVKPSGIIV